MEGFSPSGWVVPGVLILGLRFFHVEGRVCNTREIDTFVRAYQTGTGIRLFANRRVPVLATVVFLFDQIRSRDRCNFRMKKQTKSGSSTARLHSIEPLEDRKMLASDLEFFAAEAAPAPVAAEAHYHEGYWQDDIWHEGHWHVGESHDDQLETTSHSHGDEPCTCPACMGAAAGNGDAACASVVEAETLGHNHNHDHGHGEDGLLRFGPEGHAYFFDPAPEELIQSIPSPSEAFEVADVVGGETGGGEIQLIPSVPALHSNPSATQKIFLDFDGHVTGNNILWNNFNGGDVIHAPPFSLDDNLDDFSPDEVDVIQQTFERVAEDFANFDVDVTTEDPGAALFTQGNQAIRVVVSTDVDDARVGGTGNEWFSRAGGVAYLNSWTWRSDTPVWTFYNNLYNDESPLEAIAKNVAEASSHEAGHALGLAHDGNGNNPDSYYRGHGNGATGWAPIMGVGYFESLTQWSRGEYDNANNGQNDVNIIRQKLQYRADDFGNNSSSAAAIVPVGETSVNIAGVIEQENDVDVFRIDAFGQTTISLEFDVIDTGSNLDLQVELFDSTGALVASSNPSLRLDASLNRTVDAGTYTVVVDGVGKGDLSNGYSDYGSLGQYFITGTVESADPVAGGPVVISTPTSNSVLAPTSVTIDFNQPVDASSFSFDDVTAFLDPDGNDVSPMLTGHSFLTPTQLQLEFAALDVNGLYSMTFGPEIYDVEGLAMDQNENGVSGEADDDYSFEFVVAADSSPGIAPSAGSLVASGETEADSVIISFDQNMDTSSFDPVVDIQFFVGPEGDIWSSVSSFEWVSLTDLQINFEQQTAVGDYTIVVGPNILDLEGLPMDQNGDGTSGLSGVDWYSGTFTLGSTAVPGDFNGDEQIDVADIDILCSEIMSGNSSAAEFDLNGDGVVNHDDQNTMIVDIIGSLPGDGNLDFSVDGSDFNLWNANKFTNTGGWGNGDFTCDGTTDGSDFNVWNSFKFQSGSGAIVVAPSRSTDLPTAAASPVLTQPADSPFQPQAAAPVAQVVATFSTDSIRSEDSAEEEQVAVIDSIWADSIA